MRSPRLVDFSAAVIAGVSVVSSLLQLLDGNNDFCGMGVLFWPESRFSDLFLPIESLNQGAFVEFSEYPAGSALVFGAFAPLQETTLRLPAWMHGPCHLTTPATALAQVVMALLISATVGVGVAALLGKRPKFYWLGGAIAAGTFAASVTLIGHYTTFSLGLGFTVLVVMGIARLKRQQPPSGILALSFGSAFPFVFAWDRGNIDGVVGVLVVWTLLLISRGGKKNWYIAAVLLGTASAIKLWPVFLFGLYIRPLRLREIGLGILSFLITLTVGAVIVANIGFAFTSILGTSGRAASMGSPWLLYFNRTLWSWASSLWLFIDRQFPAPWISSPAFDALVTYSTVFGLIAATGLLMLNRPLWQRITMSSVIVLLLAPTSGAYRLTLLYAVLIVTLLQIGRIPLQRSTWRVCIFIFLLSLSTAPLYLGRIPQPLYSEAPWMGPPSDTLVGVTLLLLLGAISVSLFFGRPEVTRAKKDRDQVAASLLRDKVEFAE